MVQPLSNVQMEILQAFRFEMDDDQLRDFRQHLVDYFAIELMRILIDYSRKRAGQ